MLVYTASARAAPNNGMHPTPNERAFYQLRQQGAGDAQRYALPGFLAIDIR